MSDLKIPDGLGGLGRVAADVVLRTAREICDGGEVFTGGCRAFYSPQEWRDRGEEYGLKAVLIVVHDGGGLARFFNYDYQDYGSIDKMDKALRECGVYAEACTCWYTAIYKIEAEELVGKMFKCPAGHLTWWGEEKK